MKLFYITSVLFVSLILAGCFQEDPQVSKTIKNERDSALLRVKELEAKLANSNSGGAEDSRKLQKKNASLEDRISTLSSELAKAKREATEAKLSSEPMSEEELLIRLRRATEDHRKKIRERFDVVNMSLTEFSMPDKLTHPYRCSVHYDLTEKSSGKAYQIDVHVRAPLSGEWKVPTTDELAKNLKEGHGGGSATVATNNQGNQSATSTTNNNTSSTRSGVSGTVRVNGLPSGGQVQGQGGQATVRVQPVAPQPQPATTRRTPSGPGLGRVSRDIRVNW